MGGVVLARGRDQRDEQHQPARLHERASHQYFVEERVAILTWIQCGLLK
jgi:hypothetical protein